MPKYRYDCCNERMDEVVNSLDKRIELLEGCANTASEPVSYSNLQLRHDTRCLAVVLGREGEGRDMLFLLDVVHRVRVEFEKLQKRHRGAVEGADALRAEADELRKMNAVHVEEIEELRKDRDARIAELRDLRAQDSDEQRLIRATLDEAEKQDVRAKEDAAWLVAVANDIRAPNFRLAVGSAIKLEAIARRLRGEPDEVKGHDKQAREDADWLNKLKYQFAAPLNGETRNRLTDIARRLRGNTK